MHFKLWQYTAHCNRMRMRFVVIFERPLLIHPFWWWIRVTNGKMIPLEHKKGNMFKAKTLIEKVDTRYLKQVPLSPQQTIPDHRLYLSAPQTGALNTSADNSWPPPLPFHTALKIPQSNIFTLFQHGSSSQTHSLTHIDKHTHFPT